MRIIRDNIYLFSVARSCPGKIVACRTNDGDGAVGKNINDVIALDKADLDYVFSREGNEEYRSVCLSCQYRGERKAVAFFDFMCRSSSLCLAVVFDFEISSAAKAMSALGYGNADLAPSLTRLCDDSFSIADHEAFMYIAYVYGCIAPLGELRACRSFNSAELLRRYVNLAADFIGVEVEYSTKNDQNITYFNDERSVFAGGICASAILISSILARKFSDLGMLYVEVVMGRDGASVCFGIDTKNALAFDSAKFLGDVADSYGALLDRITTRQGVSLLLVPFYVDVGLAEVKERDMYPSISEFL